MNAELLRIAGEHVQEEHRKLRDLNGTLDRALEVAVAAYLSGKPPDELPGSPPADPDDRLAWLEYFIGQGALALHPQLTGAAV